MTKVSLSGLAQFEQEIDELRDFAQTYLRDHGVAGGLAERVADEVIKVRRATPNWNSFAVSRQDMVLRLFWTLAAGGRKSDGSYLTGSLLRELCLWKPNVEIRR